MYSLSPLFVFLTLYLVTSIIAQDFYKVPITVAFLISTIYAFTTLKGSVNKRIGVFAKGAGNSSMVLMLLIFILAGAFASSAKEVGAVDATVNATLRLLPSSLILPGIFLASCFISLSIGTSCGTIAALTPIAVGMAQHEGISLPLMVGLVVGGTYFGDNLSFISDTTIIATQTQGCKMNDKFKVNIKIVAPVAVLMLILYYALGTEITGTHEVDSVDYWKVMPYVVVIITALFGVNVLLVLIIGLILTAVIGIIEGTFDIFGWFSAVNSGIMGMAELIVVTILAGGMLSIIRHNGGIDYIIEKLTRRINGKRGAEATIAALVCLVNICTANNTVAIITSGSIANDIATRYHIDKRRSASILDTASCFMQGLLPYGAQVLIAASLSGLNPLSIITYLYYPLAIGIALVLCIIFRYPRGVSR